MPFDPVAYAQDMESQNDFDPASYAATLEEPEEPQGFDPVAYAAQMEQEVPSPEPPLSPAAQLSAAQSRKMMGKIGLKPAKEEKPPQLTINQTGRPMTAQGQAAADIGVKAIPEGQRLVTIQPQVDPRLRHLIGDKGVAADQQRLNEQFPALIEERYQQALPQMEAQAQAQAERERNKIGVVETLGAKSGFEAVPFVGSVPKIAELLKIRGAAKRIENNEYDDPDQRQKDMDQVIEWAKKRESEQQRGKTFGADVADVVYQLPTLMLEYALTAGVAAVGRKGVEKAALKVGGRIAEKAAAKAATKAIGVAAGEALRLPLIGTGRIAEKALERQSPVVTQTEDGRFMMARPTEKPMTSFVKAVGDQYIEQISEQSGGALRGVGRVASRALPKRIVNAIGNAWIRAKGGRNAVSFARQIMEKGGFHGVLEEMGEERVGDVLRAITGVEDFGTGEDATWLDRLAASVPDGRQLLVEMASFAVPGAARIGLGPALEKEAPRPTAKAEQPVEAPTRTEPTVPRGTPEERAANAFQAIRRTPDLIVGDRLNEDAMAPLVNQYGADAVEQALGQFFEQGGQFEEAPEPGMVSVRPETPPTGAIRGETEEADEEIRRIIRQEVRKTLGVPAVSGITPPKEGALPDRQVAPQFDPQALADRDLLAQPGMQEAVEEAKQRLAEQRTVRNVESMIERGRPDAQRFALGQVGQKAAQDRMRRLQESPEVQAAWRKAQIKQALAQTPEQGEEALWDQVAGDPAVQQAWDRINAEEQARSNAPSPTAAAQERAGAMEGFSRQIREMEKRNAERTAREAPSRGEKEGVGQEEPERLRVRDVEEDRTAPEGQGEVAPEFPAPPRRLEPTENIATRSASSIERWQQRLARPDGDVSDLVARLDEINRDRGAEPLADYLARTGLTDFYKWARGRTGQERPSEPPGSTISAPEGETTGRGGIVAPGALGQAPGASTDQETATAKTLSTSETRNRLKKRGFKGRNLNDAIQSLQKTPGAFRVEGKGAFQRHRYDEAAVAKFLEESKPFYRGRAASESMATRMWWAKFLKSHGKLKLSGEFGDLMESYTINRGGEIVPDPKRGWVPHQLFNFQGGGMEWDELVDALAGNVPESVVSTARDADYRKNFDNVLRMLNAVYGSGKPLEVNEMVEAAGTEDGEAAEDEFGYSEQRAESDIQDLEDNVKGMIERGETLVSQDDLGMFTALEAKSSMFDLRDISGRELAVGDKFKIGRHEFTVVSRDDGRLKAENDVAIDVPEDMNIGVDSVEKETLPWSEPRPVPAPQPAPVALGAEAKPGRDFSKNKIFTADKVEAARERMRKRLGQIGAGFDPEAAADMLAIGGAHVEAGLRDFTDWARAVVKDLGDGVRPYLLMTWQSLRHYPGFEQGNALPERTQADLDAIFEGQATGAAQEALAAPAENFREFVEAQGATWPVMLSSPEYAALKTAFDAQKPGQKQGTQQDAESRGSDWYKMPWEMTLQQFRDSGYKIGKNFNGDPILYTPQGASFPLAAPTVPMGGPVKTDAEILARMHKAAVANRAVAGRPVPDEVLEEYRGEPWADKALGTPTPVAPSSTGGDAKVTGRLRKIADGMQKAIDAKMNPAIGQLNVTARRARIAGSMRAEGEAMQKVQQALRGLADAHEDGTIPEVLSGITTKAQIEDLVRSYNPKSARLKTAGITTDNQWAGAKSAIEQYVQGATPEQRRQREIKEAEEKLIGVKIPGFFPTPRPLIDQMLREADIQPGESVLEPSAGKGDILDAIRETAPEANAVGIEQSASLAEIANLKGNDVQQGDFLETRPMSAPDKVVMNPPFEKGQDIDHVRHAFEIVKPGGRVVAIMSEGVFFRSGKKETAFREWLEEVGGTSVRIPSGAFTGAGAFRQTGVATRMVTIDKPSDDTLASAPMFRKSAASRREFENEWNISYPPYQNKSGQWYDPVSDEIFDVPSGDKREIERLALQARSRKEETDQERREFLRMGPVVYPSGTPVVVREKGREVLVQYDRDIRQRDPEAKKILRVGGVQDELLEKQAPKPKAPGLFQEEPEQGTLFGSAAESMGADRAKFVTQSGAVEEVNLNEITRDQWADINKRMVAAGYDWRGANDAKQIMTAWAERSQNAIGGDHADVILSVLGRADEKPENPYSPDETKRIFAKAKREFGTTNNPSEAFYLLPDGTMLDGSGVREGNDRGTRVFDHRQIGRIVENVPSGYEAMWVFQRMGAVRFIPESNAIDVAAEPTTKQLRAIRRLAEDSSGRMVVEAWSSKQGRYYMEYETGTPSSQIVNDLLKFYSSGTTPTSSTTFGSAAYPGTPATEENTRAFAENVNSMARRVAGRRVGELNITLVNAPGVLSEAEAARYPAGQVRAGQQKNADFNPTTGEMRMYLGSTLEDAVHELAGHWAWHSGLLTEAERSAVQKEYPNEETFARAVARFAMENRSPRGVVERALNKVAHVLKRVMSSMGLRTLNAKDVFENILNGKIGNRAEPGQAERLERTFGGEGGGLAAAWGPTDFVREQIEEWADTHDVAFAYDRAATGSNYLTLEKGAAVAKIRMADHPATDTHYNENAIEPTASDRRRTMESTLDITSMAPAERRRAIETELGRFASEAGVESPSLRWSKPPRRTPTVERGEIDAAIDKATGALAEHGFASGQRVWREKGEGVSAHEEGVLRVGVGGPWVDMGGNKSRDFFRRAEWPGRVVDGWKLEAGPKRADDTRAAASLDSPAHRAPLPTGPDAPTVEDLASQNIRYDGQTQYFPDQPPQHWLTLWESGRQTTGVIRGEWTREAVKQWADEARGRFSDAESRASVADLMPEAKTPESARDAALRRFGGTVNAAWNQKWVEPAIRKAHARATKLGESHPQMAQWARRSLRQRFNQDPVLLEAFETMQFQYQKDGSFRNAAVNLLKDSKASVEEIVALDRALHGHPRDFENLNAKQKEHLRGTMDFVRNEARRVSTELKSLGLPYRESWIDGMDSWYPNQWKGHMNANVGGTIFNTLGRALGFRRGDLQHTKRRTSDRWVVYQGKKIAKDSNGQEAIFDNQADAQAFIDRTGGPFIARYKVRDANGKWKMVEESFASRKERADFMNQEAQKVEAGEGQMRVWETDNQKGLRISPPMTLDQKIAHGLVEDMVSNLRAFRGAQALTSKARFFDSLAKRLLGEDADGELFSREGGPRDDAYSWQSIRDLGLSLETLAKGNVAVREFNSGWIRSDLAEDLKQYFGGGGMTRKQLRRIEQFMRKNVTYRNPWRHPKQFIENEMMMFLADMPISMDAPGRARSSADYWSHYGRNQDPTGTLKEFIEEHHFPETDYVTGELASDYAKAMAAGEEQTQTFIDSLMAMPRRYDEVMKTLYSHEDALYKFQLYDGLRKRGYESEQAAKVVRDYMFDWGNAPAFVRALRFIPFGPSVAWQFTRIFANKMRYEGPTTMLKGAFSIAALIALREAMDDWAGLDDDDREKKDYGRFEFVTPFADSRGRNISFDISYIVPYRAVLGAGQREFSPKELRSFWRSFMPMWLQAPTTVVSQQDRWGNPLLWDGTKDPTKIQQQWARFGMQVVTDSLPGFPVQTMTSFIRNAQREPDKRQDWWMQALTVPMGVRGHVDWNKRSGGGKPAEKPAKKR